MSQGDVAKALSVHCTHISGVERGSRNPLLLTIKKIAKSLSASINNSLK